VRNDVSLDDETSHILLYGINSSGKSTILRGVLSIIMVQSCMHRVGACIYVLSKNEMRILTPDNISKGLSSFTAEVHEMRETLRTAGPRSYCWRTGCVTYGHKSATALVGVLIKSIGEKGYEIFHHDAFPRAPGAPQFERHVHTTCSTYVDELISTRSDTTTIISGPCEPDYGSAGGR
jgi:hypothetical protein